MANADAQWRGPGPAEGELVDMGPMMPIAPIKETDEVRTSEGHEEASRKFAYGTLVT